MRTENKTLFKKWMIDSDDIIQPAKKKDAETDKHPEEKKEKRKG